jgi:hypothetical protein
MRLTPEKQLQMASGLEQMAADPAVSKDDQEAAAEHARRLRVLAKKQKIKEAEKLAPASTARH